VHRIGRTGRSGKTGIATTFINKANDESVLLDLKHLLIEAKQKVPLFLAAMQSENEKYLDLGGKISNHILSEYLELPEWLLDGAKRKIDGKLHLVPSSRQTLQIFEYQLFISDERGCSYCGGLGHRITNCPKLEAIQSKQASNIGRRDYLANTAADY